jgi:redox-sensitive bicupin YhaK (pirin superfamily)
VPVALVTYEDTNGASGVLPAGGIEWMQAGRGVWHSGGIGEQGRVQGFQLWVALPPHLELGPSVSIYQGAADLQTAGPARVLLGSHGGATSPIESPSDINYLAVRLQAGERWCYVPPAAHDVLWVALGKGTVRTPDDISHGELAIFAPGHQPVEFVAETDAEFMLGSAARHPHNLVLGTYSVHTNADALAAGERRIREIYDDLVQAGRF